MSAPPSGLITALRSGIVGRHLFFYLDHPAGAVRVWDGIGKMTFGGNVYDGLGGLIEVSGVSNSADLQNHSPSVTLNRVPMTSLQSNTSDVRKRAATIAVAHYTERGELVASRTLFSGYGDCLITKINETEARVTLKLRAKIADWSIEPRAYYTTNDQAELYQSVTDTGLTAVRSLETANISGWSINSESSGGLVGLLNMMLRDSGTGAFMHFTGKGGIVMTQPTGIWGVWLSRIAVNNHSSYAIEEVTTGAANGPTSTGYLNFGGTNSYVDTSGDARTGGGNLITFDTMTSAQKLKRVATISSNGVATAETIDMVASQFTNGAGSVFSMMKRSTGTLALSSGDSSALIFNNARGHVFYRSGSFYELTYQNHTGTAVSYVEDVTNTAVSISGGNKLQVGGVNCVVSSTGIVLSSVGRRIKQSGSDSTTNFLRVIS